MVAVRSRQRRHHRQRRQSGQRFDVVRRFHRVVQILAEDRQPDSADDAHKKRQQDVPRLLRPRRARGHERRIDDSNVARAQPRRDARLLQLLQQAVVELLVRLGVVLQDVVLHQLFRHVVRFGLLLVQRFLENLDVALGRVVVLPNAIHQHLAGLRQVGIDLLLLVRSAAAPSGNSGRTGSRRRRTARRDRTSAFPGPE